MFNQTKLNSFNTYVLKNQNIVLEILFKINQLKTCTIYL
jgi:hypothetical protein